MQLTPYRIGKPTIKNNLYTYAPELYSTLSYTVKEQVFIQAILH